MKRYTTGFARPPKNKAAAKEETKEVCPNCGAKLLLVTKGDGSKYYGCSDSAKCTYAREYVPHLFKRQQRVRPALGEDQRAPAKDAPKAADEASLLLQPATPDPDAQTGPLLDPTGRPETDGVSYNDAQLPSGAIFSDPLWSLPAEIAEPLIDSASRSGQVPADSKVRQSAAGVERRGAETGPVGD